MNRTVGWRDGPRPSITPVSRTARSLASGTVIDETPDGTAGNVVTEGVNPAIVVVVVVVVVVDASVSRLASGSTGTTGDGTAALLFAMVVVVVCRGELTTFTDNAKSGSVINITTERSP